jgi:hypothetical protein
MKRGVDESAIESMAEAADPMVLGRNKHGAFVEITKNNSFGDDLPLHYSFS